MLIIWLIISLAEDHPHPASLARGKRTPRAFPAVFSFLYFLKIKISKIYVRFELFQKYTLVALP